MAYRLRCFKGPVGAQFVQKRSWSCIRNLSKGNIDDQLHGHGLRRRCLTLRSLADVHINRSFITTPFAVSSKLSKLLSIDIKKARVLAPQDARPMSQFSRGDADIERMHQALREVGKPQSQDPGSSRLIYRIRGLGVMRACTAIFYVTALTGAYMTPDLISAILEHESVNGEMLLNIATVALATVVMPILLTTFNRRLVLQLHYNDAQKSYVAMTQTPIFTVKRLEFSLNDVKPNKKTGTFLSLFNLKTLKAKGRPLFFNPYNFTVPSDFNRLMGYEQV